MVWSPWDFLGSPLQHNISPGPSPENRADVTEANPTSLASQAWEPPPRQEQLVLWCLSSRGVQADRHFLRWDGEHSISDQKKQPYRQPRWVERYRGTAGSRPLSWMFSSLCRKTDVFCPVNLPAAIYRELSTVLNLQLTRACQPQKSPELPQQLEEVNLHPQRSNLLKFAISKETAQILPLTQIEELLRDVGQIMS